MTRPTVFHIPVCPFSQRLEILLELKGRREALRDQMPRQFARLDEFLAEHSADRTFVFESDWRLRPWPPQDKYRVGATDAQPGFGA